MLLKENPFYLLEIDSLTSKQGINEAADDKSFDDPDNEEKYENARDSLFNLRKRVNAEISWFLGMSWQDVPKSESELKSRQNYPNPIATFTAILNEIPDLSVEDAVVKIPELDSLYLKLKPEIIKQIINQDRKKAGIALVQDNEIIDEGLKNLDEDVHQAILKLTRKMKQPVYTRLANEIAENLVRQKASYGNLLLRFFDTYDLDITKYVLDEEKEIKKILSDKNIIHKASSFSDLEIHVRKVASMTKARCLLTDAKGTEDFGEIIRIFQFIYDKFFDFYNEDHDANLSYRIIILLKDNFPIIAKKKSGFEKNFETIKDIVSREGEKNRNKHTSQLVNTSQVYQDAEVYVSSEKDLENVLARKSFTWVDEGWQYVLFDEPVEITGADVYVDGTSNMLALPELRKSETLKKFLNVIETKESLKELIKNGYDGNINVYIGQESSFDDLKDFTIITYKQILNDKEVGTIGIIGPKRMDYKKVIPTIKYIGDILQEKINKERGGNKTDGEERKK